MLHRLFSFLGVLLLFGCSSIPKDLNVLVDQDKDIAKVQKDIDGNVGVNVRWGGVIAKTQNKEDDTWIEIVDKKLDFKARPFNNDESNGRFLVRIKGFVDPLIFAKNREITIVGQITGMSKGKIGEHPYQFTVVKATARHLWPKRKNKNRANYYPISYWGPFYYAPYPYPYIHY